MRPLDRRLRSQLAPARGPLAGVVAAGLLSSGLVITQAWVVTGLIVAALRDQAITPWAGATVAVLAARGAARWASDRYAAHAAAIVGTSLRRRLMQAVLRRPVDGSTGEVAVLATRGVAAAEPYLTRYLPALVLATVLPPLTVVAIATQDLLSAVIVLATLPLVPIFGALVGLATRDRATEQWRTMASLSGHFLDVVRGLPTLVAHRRARAQAARIGEITDQYRRASLGTLRIAFASSAILELVATLSVALVAVTIGVRLASGSVGLETALVVLLLAPEAYWPLRRVGAEFHAAAEGAATLEAASAILDDPGSDAVDAAAPAGTALVVDRVGVRYPGRTTPALHDVSAVLPPIGVTAITGPSGCGKSTLLAVLAGLLPPDSGAVLADGRPVGGAAQRSHVAWLPQRPTFVTGSIADNLRLAARDATDDQLWAALREVALEERVRTLPGRLGAPLGENGGGLSAGERARLALARVVLADRPWVLLDEPTAHLDPLTEQVIADTIAALGRRGAVVVVAHRPALVELADHEIRLSAPESAAAPAPAPSGTTQARPLPQQPPSLPAPTRGLAVATVLDALASASGVALTATAGWLIVQASTHPPVLTLLVAVVGVRAFGLARPALRYVERLRSHDAALQLLARRRVQVYEAIVPLTPARLGRHRGDVLTSIVDDVDSVVDRELKVRMPVRGFALVAAMATAVALFLDVTAGLVTGGFCLLAGGAAGMLARAAATRAEHAAVRLRADLSSAVVETVQIADELRMWQAIEPAVERVARISGGLGRASRGAAAWQGAARALVLALAGVAMALMAQVGATALAAGTLSGPMLALLVLLPLALSEVALPVADAGALSARTRAAADRLERLEHTPPAVRDTAAIGVPTSYDVDVSRVRARWTPNARTTSGISLRLEPGERIAITGPSGCGKSTLAALLLRFLDPEQGSITMGGVGLRSLAPDDVRRRVGLVDDDPHIFATTLAENVRLARPDASDNDVEQALRRAHLGSWLDALPDRLQTWLGDGHAQVSGGERARLGIARALLANQPVLVLDEPAAHLDHATATSLAHEVLTGSRHRSVLWITHDHVGLDLADRVVDLGP